MEVPNYLLEQIQAGKVVLFLGAGASLDSLCLQILQNMLCRKSISDSYISRPHDFFR